MVLTVFAARPATAGCSGALRHAGQAVLCLAAGPAPCDFDVPGVYAVNAASA